MSIAGARRRGRDEGTSTAAVARSAVAASVAVILPGWANVAVIANLGASIGGSGAFTGSGRTGCGGGGSSLFGGRGGGSCGGGSATRRKHVYGVELPISVDKRRWVGVDVG